jgi:hypothetical protein
MNNVIAFDSTRTSTQPATAIRTAAAGIRDNVVSIADWKTRTRTRRTATGVFFSTGVLLTYGSAA